MASSILVIGAGRSTTALVDYLSKTGSEGQYKVKIVDQNQEIIKSYSDKYHHIETQVANIFDLEVRNILVESVDLVISMLPAQYHIHVAESCLLHLKPLLTASYVDENVKALSQQIKRNDLLFLFECGLDPGIDHMSAMQIIDDIRRLGGKVISFRSYCGGLMAPGSDDNPWQYKFTWNPRNVVLAGKGAPARYRYQGHYKNIPYHQLFNRTSLINVPGYGSFEAYPNRNSLQYQPIYGLEEAETILRGTLRRPGYSGAWHALVQLGLTEDNFLMSDLQDMTFNEFLRSFLPYATDDTVKSFCQYIGVTKDADIVQKIQWLGLFDDQKIGLTEASPATVLQHILEKKWQTQPQDQDMIVMQHQIEYQIGEKIEQKNASLVYTGAVSGLTAMAKTVGYPLGIAAKLILEGKIASKGLLIPTIKEIYQPILRELKQMGIDFKEEEIKNQST